MDEVTAQLFTLSDKLREDLEAPCTDLLEQPSQGEGVVLVGMYMCI